MTDGYVPLYAPAKMAPAFLRQIASALEEENAAEGEARETPRGGWVNGWLNVPREEIDEFLARLGPDEWDVLWTLAARNDRKPTTAELAKLLNIGTDELGGRIGPISRRARAAGLPPLFFRGKKSDGTHIWMPYPLPSVIRETKGAQPAPAEAHDTPDDDGESP